MKARRESTPTNKPRQILGDVTNCNAYSLRSGIKTPKPKPKSPEWEEIAPHFCSAESSTGSVDWLSQGGDRPPTEEIAPGSNRQSDSLGKKRKSAISEDYDEKNRNRKMKKKKKALMMTKERNKGITVEGCKRPSSGSGDIRSNSETSPDPLSENKENNKLDQEIKNLRDYYADIDAYQLIIEEVSSTPTKTKAKTWSVERKQ